MTITAQTAWRYAPIDKTTVLQAMNFDAYFESRVMGYRRTRPGKAVGLCPFHGEQHPSCHFDLLGGRFHCFGCGVGGDIFSFVMRLDGARFPEAVGILARYAGINPAMRSSNGKAAIEAARLAAQRREQDRRYAAEIRTAVNFSIDMVRGARATIVAARGIDISHWPAERLDAEMIILWEAHEIMVGEHGTANWAKECVALTASENPRQVTEHEDGN